MADTVRYLMEEMIPELEDLEKKGYFSRTEVKRIAQKRQDFEYQLKRRAALKRDFLRYIEYESKLEELRKFRRKERSIKGKKRLAELGCVRRIHFIYERATRKFKADLGLWLAWLDFCKKSKSTKQFSKVVTKALHRHSHVPALWVQASVWEFEHASNVAAARALMQQGLRHCPKDEGLWAEYVQLELLYVARLRARRAVLGLPNPDKPEEFQAPIPQVRRKKSRAQPTTQQSNGNDSDNDSDNEGAAETNGSNNQNETEPDGEAAVRMVLTGGVVRAVIKGAILAMKDSLSLRTRLLKVLREFTFPGIQQLVDFVYDSISSDFTNSEDAWDVLARRHWPAGLQLQNSPYTPEAWQPASSQLPAETDTSMEHTSDMSESWVVEPTSHQACCDAYTKALAALPTAKMHELRVRYLGQRTLPVLHAARSGNESAIQELASSGAQLLLCYQQSLDARQATEALCAGYVDWAMALNQPKLAVKAARTACDLHTKSVIVWSRRLSLELELHARKQVSAQKLLDTLQAVLKAVPASQADQLWVLALRAIPPGAPEHVQLRQHLITCLAGQAKGPLSGGMGKVVGDLLSQVYQLQGLQAFRALLKQFVKLPPPGGDMFRAAIACELDASKQDSAQRQSGEAAVRRLFETAVDAYGQQDVDLWIQYAQFEQSSSSKGVGSIYWRATKALQEPDAFIDRYREVIGLVA